MKILKKIIGEEILITTPNIVNNVEYLTGRRINNKLEYAKKIYLGSLVSGTNVISHNIPNIGNHFVIDYTNSYWTTSSDTTHFTMTYQGHINSIEVSRTQIVIVANNVNIPNYLFTVTILYTKQ